MRTYIKTCACKRLIAYVNVRLLRVERLLQQVPTFLSMTCRTKLETMTASHVRSVTIRVPALNLEVSEGKWNYPEESPSKEILR